MANVVEYALKIKDSKAKKALLDTSKAAEQAEKSTKQFGSTTTVALQNVTTSAKNQTKTLRSLRKDTANLDRLSGELAVGLSAVNSELGAGVRMASNFAGALEGGVRAMLVQNKTLLALTVAVGALSVAYNFFSGKSEEAEKKQKKLNDAISRSTKKIRDQIKSLKELNNQSFDIKQSFAQIKNQENLLKAEIKVLEAIKSGNKEKIRSAKINETRLKRELKGLSIGKQVVSLTKQQLKNAQDRANAARITIQEIEKIQDANGSIAQVEKDRLKTAKENLESSKIDIDILKEKLSRNLRLNTSIKAQSLLHKKNVLEQDIKDQIQKEKEASEQAKKLAEQKRKTAKFAKEILDPVDKLLSNTKQVLIDEKKLTQIIEKNGVIRLRNQAQLLKTQAQFLPFAESENKLTQANNLLKKANIRDNQILINSLIKQKDMILEQIAAEDALIDKQVQKLLKAPNTKQKIKLQEQLAKKTEQLLEKQLILGDQLKSLDRQIQQERENFALKQDSIDEQNHQNKIKRISKEQEKRKKEADERLNNIKIVNQTQAKLQKIVDDTELKRIELIAQKRLEAVQKITSGITAFADSIVNPQALIQQATSTIGSVFGEIGGVIGSAVGGIVGSIARLGEKTPKEIQQEMTGFLEAFEKGLEMLPDLLVKILPRFAVAVAEGVILSIPMLLKGVGESLVELGVFLIENMRQFFEQPQKFINEKSDQEFSRMSKIFDKYFGISFQNQAQIKEAFSFRSGGRILSARSGARVTSGYFGAAQMAMVHPGEIITPQSGTRPQAIDRTLNQMSAGQSVTVVINSAVTEASAIDGLVRKIENRFRTFGSATSPLFG